MELIPPKKMADQIVRLLRRQHPDPSYVKKEYWDAMKDFPIQ
jgi:hypothetical protein